MMYGNANVGYNSFLFLYEFHINRSKCFGCLGEMHLLRTWALAGKISHNQY